MLQILEGATYHKSCDYLINNFRVDTRFSEFQGSKSAVLCWRVVVLLADFIVLII